MSDQLKFLPFHAINEFMRDDFRLTVIRNVLGNISEVDKSRSIRINNLTNKLVKIPGFRNPARAPTAIKIIPVSKAFEKHPELVAEIISAWVESHPVLRDEVYELLKVREWTFMTDNIDMKEMLKNWRILPIDADRTSLPGFYTIWPKGENFEIIYNTYTDLYPNSENSIDNVSLMVVWLTMRLPYQVEEDEMILEHDSPE